MPTIAELVTATETKLAQTETILAWELEEVRLSTQRLTQAEQRKAQLLTRLAALKTLALETP